MSCVTLCLLLYNLFAAEHLSDELGGYPKFQMNPGAAAVALVWYHDLLFPVSICSKYHEPGEQTH